MMSTGTAYREPVDIPDDIRKELNEHPEMVQQLLFNRGVHTKEDAEVFLNPDFDIVYAVSRSLIIPDILNTFWMNIDCRSATVFYGVACNKGC